MADLTEITLTTVVPAVLSGVLSGVGAVIATVWKYNRNISNRLTSLETWKSGLYVRDNAEHKHNVSTLESTLKQDISTLHEDIKQMSAELSSKKKLLVVLSTKVDATQQRVAGCESSINSVSDQQITYAKEQAEQWQNMSRNLGRLEGYLSKSSHQLGQFPSPKS